MPVPFETVPLEKLPLGKTCKIGNPNRPATRSFPQAALPSELMIFVALLIALFAMTAFLPPASAETFTSATSESPQESKEFALERTGYRGDEEISRQRILFGGEIAIEIHGDGSRYLTAYSPHQVVLMDRRGQVKSTILQSDLKEFAKQIEAEFLGSSRAKQSGVNASVQHQSFLHQVQFGAVNYQLKTIAANKYQSKSFRTYADSSVLLGFKRGTMLPPFARLKLNESLEAAEQIPSAAKIEIKGTGVYRFETRLSSMTEIDKKRFTNVESMLSLYQEIPLEEFRQE